MCRWHCPFLWSYTWNPDGAGPPVLLQVKKINVSSIQDGASLLDCSIHNSTNTMNPKFVTKSDYEVYPLMAITMKHDYVNESICAHKMNRTSSMRLQILSINDNGLDVEQQDQQ